MAWGTCTPEQRAACPLSNHHTDIHHAQYPRRDYKTKTERAYRELPENKVRLCRFEHQEIHATQPIPEKPSTAEMLQAIAESALRGINYGEEATRPAVHSGLIQPNAA